MPDDNAALLRRVADMCVDHSECAGDDQSWRDFQAVATNLRALADLMARYEAALALAKAEVRYETALDTVSSRTETEAAISLADEWDAALDAYRALGEEA